MKYRTLGRTGIKVSPYCLGTIAPEAPSCSNEWIGRRFVSFSSKPLQKKI